MPSMNSTNSNDFVMKRPFLFQPERERSFSSTWVAVSLVKNGTPGAGRLKVIGKERRKTRSFERKGNQY